MSLMSVEIAPAGFVQALREPTRSKRAAEVAAATRRRELLGLLVRDAVALQTHLQQFRAMASVYAVVVWTAPHMLRSVDAVGEALRSFLLSYTDCRLELDAEDLVPVNDLLEVAAELSACFGPVPFIGAGESHSWQATMLCTKRQPLGGGRRLLRSLMSHEVGTTQRRGHACEYT